MHARTVTLAALLAVALVARAAYAQTSRPSKTAAGSAQSETRTRAVAPAPAPVETIIRRPSNATAPTTQQTGATKTSAIGFDSQRVVLALAIVLGLIFALRWLSQRLLGKTVGGRASRAVQVLSRNVISPKQQLLVVQVGRRLVVIGDSGQQMNALCEITDSEEITALIGQLHDEKRESSSNPFGSIFGRAGSAFDKENEPPRSLDVASEDDDRSTEPSRDEQETRDELSGLMDKVRGMSRQFRRT